MPVKVIDRKDAQEVVIPTRGLYQQIELELAGLGARNPLLEVLLTAGLKSTVHLIKSYGPLTTISDECIVDGTVTKILDVKLTDVLHPQMLKFNIRGEEPTYFTQIHYIPLENGSEVCTLVGEDTEKAVLYTSTLGSVLFMLDSTGTYEKTHVVQISQRDNQTEIPSKITSARSGINQRHYEEASKKITQEVRLMIGMLSTKTATEAVLISTFLRNVVFQNTTGTTIPKNTETIMQGLQIGGTEQVSKPLAFTTNVEDTMVTHSIGPCPFIYQLATLGRPVRADVFIRVHTPRNIQTLGANTVAFALPNLVLPFRDESDLEGLEKSMLQVESVIEFIMDEGLALSYDQVKRTFGLNRPADIHQCLESRGLEQPGSVISVAVAYEPQIRSDKFVKAPMLVMPPGKSPENVPALAEMTQWELLHNLFYYLCKLIDIDRTRAKAPWLL